MILEIRDSENLTLKRRIPHVIPIMCLSIIAAVAQYLVQSRVYLRATDNFGLVHLDFWILTRIDIAYVSQSALHQNLAGINIQIRFLSGTILWRIRRLLQSFLAAIIFGWVSNIIPRAKMLLRRAVDLVVLIDKLNVTVRFLDNYDLVWVLLPAIMDALVEGIEQNEEYGDGENRQDDQDEVHRINLSRIGPPAWLLRALAVRYVIHTFLHLNLIHYEISYLN